MVPIEVEVERAKRSILVTNRASPFSRIEERLQSSLDVGIHTGVLLLKELSSRPASRAWTARPGWCCSPWDPTVAHIRPLSVIGWRGKY